MAAPSIRAVGTAVFGTTGTLAPTIPTNQAGDLLVLVIGADANASVTPTASTGAPWTLYDGSANSAGTIRAICKVYVKIASGADTAPTVTLTPTGATACHQSAVVISVQGVNNVSATAAEEATVNDSNTASSNADSFTISTDATVMQERLVLLTSMFAGASVTSVTATGYAQQLDTNNSTGIGGCLYVGTKTTAGVTSGSQSITFTGGAANGVASIALKAIPTVFAASSLGPDQVRRSPFLGRDASVVTPTLVTPPLLPIFGFDGPDGLVILDY